MVLDTRRTLPAAPEVVWPWLIQLGKRRAGWYLPASVERVVPPSRRAARVIDPRWQDLAVGDRIPDYGGADEVLEVVSLDAPRALVFRSQRGQAVYSWALLLTPRDDGTRTQVHLRFRAALRSTGLKRRLITGTGELFDRVTGELMLRGLAERLA
jgi:hypothetical protein